MAQRSVTHWSCRYTLLLLVTVCHSAPSSFHSLRSRFVSSSATRSSAFSASPAPLSVLAKMSAQAGSQPESAYEEFVIAHDYTCDFCTDLSYDYPDGLAKHDVLSREQWWAIMSRLNAAYAPGCSDCLRYAWILLILPVVCLCCECISGCFGCARHNAYVDSEPPYRRKTRS